MSVSCTELLETVTPRIYTSSYLAKEAMQNHSVFGKMSRRKGRSRWRFCSCCRCHRNEMLRPLGRMTTPRSYTHLLRTQESPHQYTLFVSPSFSSRSLPDGIEFEIPLYNSHNLEPCQLPNTQTVHSTEGGAALAASFNGESHVSTFQPLQLCFSVAGPADKYTQWWSCSTTRTRCTAVVLCAVMSRGPRASE